MYQNVDIMTAMPINRLSPWYGMRWTTLCMALVMGLLAGCADRPLRTPDVGDAIRTELAPAPAKAAVPARISEGKSVV